MGLTNGVFIDTTSSLSSTSSSSTTSTVVSAVSSAIAGGESRESTDPLWINSLTNFTSNNATESNLSLSAAVSSTSSSTIGSMFRSTLSDQYNTSAATLLSTLSTLTFSPFSTISPPITPTSTSSATKSFATSITSPSPSTSTSTFNLVSALTSPEAFRTNITSTTEASSSTVSVNHTYLDRSNSTLVNFYRTLTNPISLLGDHVNASSPTLSSSTTPTPFHESLLESSNDTVDENNTSDSISSVIPIASPLSFFSSLSIPSVISSSSSSSSFSSHSPSSSELINLNESLSPLSLPSPSLFSSSSISHNNSHHINSLGNWIESTFFPPSATSTLYSSSSSSFNNGNSNNSFNPSNTNFDNLISFWESIPYPKSGYTQLAIILLAFFITIIMIVIVVGNLLVCIAITTEKSLKTVQNWFIASLAVSDLLLGLVIMPFSLAYELMGYWIFGALWCDIHHALDVLLCTASINNLCLISLDRYWSVTQAVKYLKKRTPSRAIFMICFVWIFSALVSLPPLVGWKNDSIGPGECELSKDTGYVVYSSFGSFYVPAIVMVFVYAKIFVAARSRARKHVKKRKLLVAEVTNDMTKDKSTTTTTCTSMSNPSPPEGQEEVTDNCLDQSKEIRDKMEIKSNCDTINCNKQITTTGNCVNIVNKSNFDDGALTPCSTPTTLTTPKVTFSPRDTVYGEDNCADDNNGGGGKVNRHDCLSPSSNCPPPQIIIETANSSSSSSSTNNNNHANCNNNNVSTLVNVKNNVNSATNSGSNSVMINNRETNLSSSSTNSCDNQVSSKSTVATSPTIKTNYSHSGNSSSLSERKCPKLRIAIDDSIHNYNRNNSNHPDNSNLDLDCYLNSAGNDSCDYDMSTHQIAPTSILRSNGLTSINNSNYGNQTNSKSSIINETRLISADDDSDAMESPISRHSGNFALESKAFLSPSSASLGGGLCGGRFGPVPTSGGSLSGSVSGVGGGLTRSPYGSTMSIADYDDSDLCNDSGDQPEQSSSSLKGSGGGSKKSPKGKGKVQYQTPPVTRRHTPSDAERHKRKIAKARERRATLILGLIMGSFILAWLPFFVMYLTSGLCKSCQITSGLTFGYWLGYCNSAINPIIYTVFNRDFRKAFRKILFR
ncbi:MATH and LRR domain-containing protein PFE0570w-like isoform X2 [Panonychus citri]|nr:MATH and LRR domain-containing protein PFE0570w-like isoform X2 [Panonychus citri]XP_053213004.1 MATH and LRR domain-containing protein PFE0570w-like isoform X2 [Panonychus citri]XP_053213005.1 MATH and LRR domain-containing protein PFE0570w-like isoform X2 [Panonychus citri]XP_053213006.1 MATH and LRR domain-containing protein PFE0570w-like isoform X2 [Panonychus citri]